MKKPKVKSEETKPIKKTDFDKLLSAMIKTQSLVDKEISKIKSKNKTIKLA